MSKKTMIKTRVSDKLYLFEKGEDLNEEQRQLLPTYEDIIKCYKSVRLQIKGDGSKEPPSNEVANIVAQKVAVIWQRASLKTVSHKRIVDMILTYNNKYRNITEPIKNRDPISFTAKLDKFKCEAHKLFDICSCKCPSLLLCKCNRDKKIPEVEWPFISDQRNRREMRIGPLDKTATKKLSKQLERKEKDNR